MFVHIRGYRGHKHCRFEVAFCRRPDNHFKTREYSTRQSAIPQCNEIPQKNHAMDISTITRQLPNLERDWGQSSWSLSWCRRSADRSVLDTQVHPFRLGGFVVFPLGVEQVGCTRIG